VVAGSDPGGITKSAGWTGGGGFRHVIVGPSMYEVTDFGVLLADWATNGRFARAVAGQLGFQFQTKKHAPFCGVRGRMRLAVFDGTIGVEEVRQVVAELDDKERVTIVAKAVLPGAEEELAATSRGSRIRKAPRDLITTPRRTRR
jgi:adenine-specific DNA-methyltransferase